VLRVAAAGPAMWIAAGVATAVLLYWPKLHPVPVFLGSAVLFGLFDLVGLGG
jgi:hypothetical protein